MIPKEMQRQAAMISFVSTGPCKEPADTSESGSNNFINCASPGKSKLILRVRSANTGSVVPV